ncbi:MAG TPA: molybdenum cofactor guanylyltransferase [Candidatus Dormibacteraeota bacterium]|nr:molybdenum cofactor guanylyltransferase [Candidatus Dormibacteraeota bacterium]
MTERARPEAPAAASGIVLAGGRSSRFGGDKLAARIGDSTLLERAVAAVALVSTEVIVVLSAGDERELPATSVPVQRAVDPEAFGGPLVGLLAGLEAAREPIAIVAGGDMPTLAPEVLRMLIGLLLASEGTRDAAVLVQRGEMRPLPCAVRNGTATQAARHLLGEGERSLLALIRSLPVLLVAEGDWRPLDPTAATLLDVDVPGDLL